MDFYNWFFKETDRVPEGLFSFAHLFSVTLTLAILSCLSVFLAKLLKNNPKKQNLLILLSGIIIVSVQIFKIAYLLTITDDVVDCLVGNLPLYFCDITLYIIPLAALTKGRFRDCCLDFLAICGILMGFMGNYFAGNIYGSHCAFSFLAINSLLNHSISAFVSLFIFVSGLNKMEKKNIPIVIGFLFFFMTVALILDYALGKNFMFFFDGDGTPFTLFHDFVKGNKIAYQIIIYILQCGYIGLFYLAFYQIQKIINQKRNKETAITNN